MVPMPNRHSRTPLDGLGFFIQRHPSRRATGAVGAVFCHLANVFILCRKLLANGWIIHCEIFGIQIRSFDSVSRKDVVYGNDGV
jgi:hypothetical protein